MKCVLVTGGAGFIGSSITEKLLCDPVCSVVSIDNFDESYDRKYKESNVGTFKKHERYTMVEADIKNQQELSRVFNEHPITHVLHLAAKADTRKAVADPFIYVENNIVGTLNVLEEVVRAGLNHVVVASSSSVYGNNPNVPWRESDAEIHPISPYGVTKLTTEKLAFTYFKNYGLQSTFLRYFNAYGERNRPGMVPYLWAQRILNDQPIEISGDGTRRRDYTYIGDIVTGTIAALEKPLGHEVINLGYGSPLSLLDLAELFESVLGIKVQKIFRNSHPASVEATYADITKARALLDWSPTTSHFEGISALISWFRSCRL